MRIAFHAPLKPPDDPVPSGDRRMARLLIDALCLAGHEVTVASRLRSLDLAGDGRRQARIARLGARLADRYLARVRGGTAPRPELWFTYHLYHKAPDRIGPRAAASLGIPYVVAEASLAGKRASGAWAEGHEAARAALRQAAAVVTLNPADEEGLAGTVAAERMASLPPFLDTSTYRAAASARAAHRAALAREAGDDDGRPWLLAVAMMRGGDKLASYRLLGAALARLLDRPWRLLVVGDGPARPEVSRALEPLGARVDWRGVLGGAAVAGHLAAADLLVWPAVNEAWGMALLEAQAAGLPVVAGAGGGVPAVVADGATGLLVPPAGDDAFAAALAGAVGALLDDPERRRRLGAAALERTALRHDIAWASARLDGILRRAAGRA